MHETNINTELLSSDARGRKTVPLAVFAVIFIHIVLFLVLLIAAGCRARARAKMKALQQQEVVAVVTNNPTPFNSTASGAVVTRSREGEGTAGEGVLATEPDLEATAEIARPSPAVITRKPVPETQPAVRAVRAGMRVHTVQQGDTIGKIARQYKSSIESIRSDNNLKGDMIRVGQKLRITAEKPQKKQQTLAAL
jgi:LysM repeat protein